jgi:hypothetical protein
MLSDIVHAAILDGYRVELTFEDNLRGVVDLEPMLSFRGVFAPLRDSEYFKRLRVDPELGTIAWPNGADLDPDVLHAKVSGKPITLD